MSKDREIKHNDTGAAVSVPLRSYGNTVTFRDIYWCLDSNIQCYGNYWITATNIRSPPNTVSIHDSLWSKEALDRLIEQVSILTFSTNSTQINIDFKDMQRQSGGIDRELFAIASAACLCEGTDPSVHAWNQDDMRKHLNDCFETGTIQLFKSAKRRNRKSKAVQTVPLHCLCRTGRIIKKDMILCEQCHLYYHYTCVNLSAQPKERFTCQNCNV